MTAPPLLRLRNWLARKGISPQRPIYSRSIWGVRKAESAPAGGRPRLRRGDAFLVCSTEHDVDAIERLLGISFLAVLRVDRLRAHESAQVFDAWAHQIGWGQRVTEGGSAPRTMLLLCGIIGRCWAVEAFLSEPDSLTLCLGSYFDDVSLGRALKYTERQDLRCKWCLRVR